MNWSAQDKNVDASLSSAPLGSVFSPGINNMPVDPRMPLESLTDDSLVAAVSQLTQDATGQPIVIPDEVKVVKEPDLDKSQSMVKGKIDDKKE